MIALFAPPDTNRAERRAIILAKHAKIKLYEHIFRLVTCVFHYKRIFEYPFRKFV